jgi:small subunit ribosomal protein S2
MIPIAILHVIDFPIPANDDASKSIELIMHIMVKSIEEGLAERKVDKEQEREREAATEEETEERKMIAVTDEEGGESTGCPSKTRWWRK